MITNFTNMTIFTLLILLLSLTKVIFNEFCPTMTQENNLSFFLNFSKTFSQQNWKILLHKTFIHSMSRGVYRLTVTFANKYFRLVVVTLFLLSNGLISNYLCYPLILRKYTVLLK